MSLVLFLYFRFSRALNHARCSVCKTSMRDENRTKLKSEDRVTFLRRSRMKRRRRDCNPPPRTTWNALFRDSRELARRRRIPQQLRWFLSGHICDWKSLVFSGRLAECHRRNVAKAEARVWNLSCQMRQIFSSVWLLENSLSALITVKPPSFYPKGPFLQTLLLSNRPFMPFPLMLFKHNVKRQYGGLREQKKQRFCSASYSPLFGRGIRLIIICLYLLTSGARYLFYFKNF